MSFRLGIIGAGGIAAEHAKAASAIGLEIAGFCDVELAKAEKLAQQYPPAVAVLDINELLELPGIPAVVVATPNHCHKPHTLTALAAGKDVLLEKPMGLNLAECDEIITGMKQSDRFVQVNLVTRQSRMALIAYDFIQSGRLGKIYHAKASWYRRRGIPGLGRWFTTKAESGGGVLIDLGVHEIDLVAHLTGHPRPVRASAHITSNFGKHIDEYSFSDMWSGPPDLDGTCNVDDGAVGLIRYDNGMTLELNVCWAMNLPEKTLPDGITLFGDKGGCYFDTWGEKFVFATEENGHLIDSTPFIPPGNAWDMAWCKQYEAFADAVINRGASPVPAEHGRAAQSVLDALYRSNAEQREVEIPQ